MPGYGFNPSSGNRELGHHLHMAYYINQDQKHNQKQRASSNLNVDTSLSVPAKALRHLPLALQGNQHLKARPYLTLSSRG